MWPSFIDWMTRNHVGDLASLIGVVISVFGFLITVFGVTLSKRAAERAEHAAQQARDNIRLFDIVVDFSAAISTLDEIKRAHRQGQWVYLPDRYSAIRKLLIALRTSGLELTDEQLKTIQSSINNLSTLEKAVERGLGTPGTLNAAKFNALLSSDVDNLYRVLTELKKLKTGA